MSFFRKWTKFSFARIAIIALVFFVCLSRNGKSVGLLTKYSSTWNETWTDHLKRDLLHKYDKFARPTEHFNTTVVYFGLRISEVSMDDFESSIIVQGLVYMKWTDDKLKWNTSSYAGLDALIVGNHEIWQPDIRLLNSVADISAEHYGDSHCIVYSDGTVYWVPPTRFHALCDLDLRFWPFDTQNCYLQLSSWMNCADEVDLQFLSSVQPDVTRRYSQWDLISIEGNRTEHTGRSCNFTSIFYNISVRRDSPIYYATIVTPAAAVVFLILVSYWLPARSIEKLILCGFSALVISIFLMYFGQKIPPLSGKLPLLICFYSGCLHLVTISLIISVFVINLSRHPHCRPLPRGIKKILVGRLCRYLALFDHVATIDSQRRVGGEEENHCIDGNIYRQSGTMTEDCFENGGEGENIIGPTANTIQLEWILAATTIDRLAFILFSTIFAIMAMICLT